MSEVWKIVKYAPKYEVSNMGIIRNKKSGNSLKINYCRLKEKKTKARPYLSNDGKSKGYYLHRIVAEHFVENPENLPEVIHIDGDWYNNKSSNLKWISKMDNMKHANENNLIQRFKRQIKIVHKETKQEQVFNSLSECADYFNCSKGTISLICNGKYRNPNAKKRNKRGVKQFDECGVCINEFESAKEASEQLGINYGGIFQVCNYYNYDDNTRPLSYKLKKTKGFVFKYKDREEEQIDGNLIESYDISFNNIEINDTGFQNKETHVEWKEYPHLPKYMASNTGEIKHKRTDRIMKGSKVNGYRFVTLRRDNGTKKNSLIHRVIAETFLENPEEKPIVSHKDRNILNNHVENLEWSTYKENMNSVEIKNSIKNGKKGIC